MHIFLLAKCVHLYIYFQNMNLYFKCFSYDSFVFCSTKSCTIQHSCLLIMFRIKIMWLFICKGAHFDSGKFKILHRYLCIEGRICQVSSIQCLVKHSSNNAILKHKLTNQDKYMVTLSSIGTTITKPMFFFLKKKQIKVFFLPQVKNL